jgi:hypothetical protein
MSKNFYHPRTGKFCYQIDRADLEMNLKLHYQLLNLNQNQVESEGLVDLDSKQTDWQYQFINIAQLKAGNYQLTLKNISASAESFSMGPCSGMLFRTDRAFHNNSKKFYARRETF